MCSQTTHPTGSKAVNFGESDHLNFIAFALFRSVSQVFLVLKQFLVQFLCVYVIEFRRILYEENNSQDSQKLS